MRWWQALWQQRSAREQQALVIMAIALALWLGITVLARLSSYEHQLYQRLKQQQTLNQWMKEQLSHYQQARQQGMSARRRPTADLLSTVNHSLTSAGLSNAHYQIRQQADGSLVLSANPVSYVTIIGWLERLLGAYQINLLSLSVKRSDQPDQVAFDVTLSA